MSKETFYFSHDYNARADIKIKKLIAKHGMLGYGVWWSLIEDLYNNANALPTDCDMIAYDLRVHEDIVKSIIFDFDLFVVEGDNFSSLSVEARLTKRNEKSAKARASARKRWDKSEGNANASETQSDSNANKVKESKVKESKVKEKEEKKKIFDFGKELISLGIDKEVVSTWLEVRKKAKAVNSELAFKSLLSNLNSNGGDYNEIIKECAVRSWKGFKSDYLPRGYGMKTNQNTNFGQKPKITL